MDHPPSNPEQEPIRPQRIEILDSTGRPVGQSPRAVGQAPLPIVSFVIIGVCTVIYIVFNVLLGNNDRYLMQLTFSPGHGLVFPGIISHMFAHANFMHLLFNMFVLYFLGTTVELRYGAFKFAILYFASGLFAALAQIAFMPDGLLLGASGALAGVMAAFVRHYPHVRLYIWGILPVPAWLAILGWLAYNIVGARLGGQGVAFMAHLGGFLAGVVVSLIMFPPQDRPRRKPVQ